MALLEVAVGAFATAVFMRLAAVVAGGRML